MGLGFWLSVGYILASACPKGVAKAARAKSRLSWRNLLKKV
jgi:hypothetical protein